MSKKEEVPAVLETYETEIEYTCPVRGKVKQKVKVKRFAPAEAPTTVDEPLPTKSIVTKLDAAQPGILVPDDSIEESSSHDDQVR